MVEIARKIPGKSHLLPEDAWRLIPRRQVFTGHWTNAGSYHEHETWSPQQWAWEFLRRNRFFQRDCDLLDESKLQPRQRKKLPPHWYLHPYKPYSEAFERGDGGVPRWTVFSRAEDWDMNTPQRLAHGQPKPWEPEDFVLLPGQVAVVFDLNDAVDMPDLFRLQWTRTWHRLAMSSARLHAAKKRGSQAGGSVKTQAAPATARKDKLIDYLRIADAFSSKFPASLEEVCVKLHEDGRLRPGDKQLSLKGAKNSLYPMIAAARDLIYGRGYLLLLAEEASQASLKDMIAPHWPRDALPRDASEDLPLVKVDLQNPFATLQKLRK